MISSRSVEATRHGSNGSDDSRKRAVTDAVAREHFVRIRHTGCHTQRTGKDISRAKCASGQTKAQHSARGQRPRNEQSLLDIAVFPVIFEEVPDLSDCFAERLENIILQAEHPIAVNAVHRIIRRVPSNVRITRTEPQWVFADEFATDRVVPAGSSVIQLAVGIIRQAAEELVIIDRRIRLRRDLAEAVDLAMIEHHAGRADHIASGSRAIFQRPEHSAQHRLIGKHLIQRTAAHVFLLNGTSRVHHGGKLIAVIDVVFHDRRL